MNQQRIAFRRKVTYIVACMPLLLLLIWLGQPATKTSDGTNPGGELAKLRTEYELSQASLGDIDPASATMRLGTLGLRGVAANILWTKAEEYKERKNWDKLAVTLNQLIKIQPHFVSVWEYQAHNLTYNVSVEFDDFQYRYHWVKKGIYFLLQGIPFNRKDHRILSNLGMFFGLKLGRSDEARQYRRMFRKDTDFHTDLGGYIEIERAKGPDGPDNWLASHEWYKTAEQMVANNPKVKIGGKSELMFYREAPSQLRNFANDLEKEFRPDERARRAWSEALTAWRQFGNRKVRTSAGTLLVLNDEQKILDKLEELRAELNALVPGARDELVATKIAALEPREFREYQRLMVPQEEVDAIKADPNLSPLEKRMAIRRRSRQRENAMELEDLDFAYRAQRKVAVTDNEVLEQAPEEVKDAAYRKYLEIADWIVRLNWVRNYQQQVHFDYWEIRALSESQEKTIRARAALYDARDLVAQSRFDAYEEVDPVTGEVVINEATGEPRMVPGAKQKYEESFRLWGEIFDEYPDLTDDQASDEMMASIGEYYGLLNSIDEDWPFDFPLQRMVDYYNQYEPSGIPSSEDLELLKLKQVELDEDEEDSPSNDTPDDPGKSDAADDGAADDNGTGAADSNAGDGGADQSQRDSGAGKADSAAK